MNGHLGEALGCGGIVCAYWLIERTVRLRRWRKDVGSIMATDRQSADA